MSLNVYAFTQGFLFSNMGHASALMVILMLLFSWNYFLFALVLSGFNTAPLTVAAFNFIGVAAIDWGGLMAAATVICLPPLILLLFVQRWLVRGLTAGAVKG